MSENVHINLPEGCFIDDILLTDAGRLFVLVTTPEIKRWMSALGDFSSLEDTSDFIEMFQKAHREGRGSLFAIRDACSNMIGFIGFCDLKFEPTIFYALAPEACGRGLATCAIKALTDYAHKQYSKPTVMATVNAGNRKSIALLKRAGFIQNTDEQDDINILNFSHYE